MDSRGNQQCSCKIHDPYLKKKTKKVNKLLEIWYLWLKKTEARSKDLNCCRKNSRAMELLLVQNSCLLVNQLGKLINYPKFSKDTYSLKLPSCQTIKTFELLIRSKSLIYELIKLINP